MLEISSSQGKEKDLFKVIVVKELNGLGKTCMLLFPPLMELTPVDGVMEKLSTKFQPYAPATVLTVMNLQLKVGVNVRETKFHFIINWMP